MTPLHVTALPPMLPMLLPKTEQHALGKNATQGYPQTCN